MQVWNKSAFRRAAIALAFSASFLGCARNLDQCELNPYACPTGSGGAGAGTMSSGGECADGPCPTCSDGIENGDEKGVDCGGASCPACNGAPCSDPAECQSTLCVDDVCCESACDGVCEACSAAITGAIDGACEPVPLGKPDGATCATLGGCGVDQACSCEDGFKNLDETGADCGGPSCSGCPIGEVCKSASDCLSMQCHNERCCPSGATCGPCHTCNAQGTCEPIALASKGACAGENTCSADVECKKQDGQQCTDASECASKFCKNQGAKKCAPCQSDADCASSADSPFCGGGWCKRGVGDPCQTDLNCLTNRCVGDTCASCAADSDCESGQCQVAAGRCLLHKGAPCTKDTDCASGACKDVCL
jgi:hypothetical protein